MPASRILDGRLPQQHPWSLSTIRNVAIAGYQGREPVAS
jgi:hypothetical protein